MVGSVLLVHQIDGFPPYNNMRAEVKYDEKSRIDFLLSDFFDTYVAVKIEHVA